MNYAGNMATMNTERFNIIRVLFFIMLAGFLLAVVVCFVLLVMRKKKERQLEHSEYMRHEAYQQWLESQDWYQREMKRLSQERAEMRSANRRISIYRGRNEQTSV